MFAKLPFVISQEICSFLNINEFQAIEKCNRLMRRVALTSICHEPFDVTEFPKYRPKIISVTKTIDLTGIDCSSVTRAVLFRPIEGVSELKNLDTITIYQFQDLSMLNFTHLVLVGNYSTTKWLPDSLKRVTIGMEATSDFIKYLAEHHSIESLKTTYVPEISLLKLTHLCIDSGRPISMPSLKSLELSYSNPVGWIQKNPQLQKLHIDLDTQFLAAFLQILPSIPHIDLSIVLTAYRPIPNLPDEFLRKITILDTDQPRCLDYN